MNYLKSSIRGSVVADDELIRQPALRGKAVQLLTQKTLTIIGGHCDRNLHLRVVLLKFMRVAADYRLPTESFPM